MDLRDVIMRTKPILWTPLLSAQGLLLATLVACGPGAASTGDTDGDSLPATCEPGEVFFESDRTCTCGEPDTWACVGEQQPGFDQQFLRPIEPRASVLVVVDDSPGMLGPQRRLAAAMEGFAKRFEEAEVGLTVMVTTADAAHPGFVCQDAPADGGTLRMASCRERLDRFQSGPGAGANPAAACTDACDLDTLDAPATDQGFHLRGGQINVANATSAGQALACMIPQGNAGCAYAQPLTAALAALDQLTSLQDDTLRSQWVSQSTGLLVLTDGTECSVQDPAIFDPDGSKALWSDPSAMTPTEAVCWNAGVSCTGGPGTYDTCAPAMKDAEGAPVTQGSDAALTPAGDLASDIDSRLETWGRAESLLLVGVPEGYPQEPIPYADSPDPTEQATYGVGPGCAGNDTLAPPPVRLAQAADVLGRSDAPTPPMGSICLPDYSAPLDDLADRLLAPIAPGQCVTVCPADVRPDLPGMQAACHVMATLYDPGAPDDTPTKRGVPPCEDTADGWAFPTPADDLCVRYLTGDELPTACTEEGWPLAFRVMRRDGATADPRDSVTVACVPADLDDPAQAAFCSPP